MDIYNICIYIGIYIVFFILFMLLLIKKSPTGYEDETGFHEIKKDEKEEIKIVYDNENYK